MSSKAIYEGDGKRLLGQNLKNDRFAPPLYVNIDEESNLDEIYNANKWLGEKVLCEILITENKQKNKVSASDT